MKRHRNQKAPAALLMPAAFLLAVIGLIFLSSSMRSPAVLPSTGGPEKQEAPVQSSPPPGKTEAQAPPTAQVELQPPAAPGEPPSDNGKLHYFPVVEQEDPPFVAKNVIILIGDGMGLEQVRAGGLFAHGAAGTLPFEKFPFQARVGTTSRSGLTDSAAASTAIATGHKVNNGVLSMAIPGSGRNYRTLLEYAHSREMSTGLITTTPLTDATPAGFGAHADSRKDRADIAADYLNRSQPEVLFGGGRDTLTPEMGRQAGYHVVTTRADMLGLDTEAETRVAGLFADTYIPYEQEGLTTEPHLSEMVGTALRILDNDPDGFFVVIEGGRIDTASHKNNTAAMVGEVAEFGSAVQAVLDWAKGRNDTVILVTADHETGGLSLKANTEGSAGSVPAAEWSTTGHTGVDVGLWIWTSRLDGIPARVENSDIPLLLTGGAFR